jgi:integrase
MPLTDTKIKNAKPQAKPYKLADERGLFLLVHSNGSRYWRWKFHFGGKEKQLALGVYPDVSLKAARDKRDEARAVLASGADPSCKRREEKRAAKLMQANTFETVASEFLDKQRMRWTGKHIKGMTNRLQANVFPYIGERPIGEIEAPELLAVLREIEDRGAYDLAHRMRQICGAVFRYGIATGRCKRDPAADLRGALTSHKKKNIAAIRPEELPELLTAIDRYDGHVQTRLALQLMALTFLRTTELIGGEWSEISLERAVWTVPAPRMKMKTEHLVPLSTQALAILEELRVLNGRFKFIFAGRNPRKHVSTNTLLFALYRMGYHSRMTGHGFRSVASTALNEAHGPRGEKLFHADLIERQLAHMERNKIRGAYNRAEYLPERRAMMQWWADHLDAHHVATSLKAA